MMDDRTLEAIPNPIFIYDSGWNIIKANKAAVDALGFTDMKGLVNRNILSLVHSNDHDNLKPIQKQLQDNTNNLSKLQLTHTKSTFKSTPGRYVSHFTKVTHTDANEHVSYLESAFCLENPDISYDQVGQKLHNYNLLSDNIHGLEMFLIDKSLQIHCKLGQETFNQGWHRNLDDGMDFLNYFSPKAVSVLKPLLNIAFDQTPVIHEFSLNNKEYFSLRLVPLDVNTEEQLYVVVLQNITQTKLIENKLKASIQEVNEANEAKDSFVAKMSHEIRTPLNAIIGFTEQLEKTRITKKQSDYIHIVGHASKHLLSVINGILELSKIESGQVGHEFIPFKIGNLLKEVDDVLKIKYVNKNLDFNILCNTLADEVLLGEPSKLRQILINLANNAIKYTPQGSVSIKCLSASNTDYERTVEFEVTDTGIGIADEEIKNIFKPFHQAGISVGQKKAGFGLGLTICKDLVESMGGTIEVESTSGKGSTFKFSLVLKKARESDIQSYEKEKQLKHLPVDYLRVLFVDDDRVNLLLGRLILDKYGIQADFSNSGVEAMHKYNESHYDIIFLDINMPDYNGMEIAKWIRSKEKELEDNQKTRIIAMTANVMKKQIETYMQAGIDSVIFKPYKEETLYRKIVAYAPESHQGARAFEQQPPTDQSAGFDLEHLLDFTKGDIGFTILMLNTFLDSTQQSLKKIQLAYKMDDYVSIAEAAHKLIPSIEQLGFKGISQQLRKIERRYLKKTRLQKRSQTDRNRN
jgi:signal transduction histidine kinase/response regulator of citrate/malate metabolism